MSPLVRKQTSTPGQRGVTLVELMVAIVISLLLVLGAASLYLNTRSTQKAVDQRAALFETGQQALEWLGRDVANAGFYPTAAAFQATPGSAFKGAVTPNFDLAVERITVPATLRAGVFGCARQDLSGQWACQARPEGDGINPDADSLVIAYFSNDTFDLDAGNRADCTRSDAANDKTRNDPARVGVDLDKPANANTKPTEPLLVVNSYFISAATPGGPSSLYCRGNGGGTVELIPNVEQMTVRYGVSDGQSDTPIRYLDAAQVSALTDVTVERVTGNGVSSVTLNGWRRVVSVRLCVMVRSDPQTRMNTVTSANVDDCTGTAVAQAPGVVLKTFSQVFGLKNRLQATSATGT